MTFTRAVSAGIVYFVALAAGAALSTGCSAGGGKAADAAVDTVSFDVSIGDLPPGCPENVVPNNKGVGRACTKGGGQCPSNLFCACDGFPGFAAPPNTPCLCTLAIVGKTCSDPTVPADYCGQNATCCGYMTLGALCVPNLCLAGTVCPDFTM